MRGIANPLDVKSHTGSNPVPSSKSISSSGLGCLFFKQEDEGSNPFVDSKLIKEKCLVNTFNLGL